MNARSVDESRIRKRIADIDQHISVLLKERDELLFAERVLERLRDSVNEPVPSMQSKYGLEPAKIVPEPPRPEPARGYEEQSEPDSIEEALLKLESKQFSIQR
jgi:hypothetical protein